MSVVKIKILGIIAAVSCLLFNATIFFPLNEPCCDDTAELPFISLSTDSGNEIDSKEKVGCCDQLLCAECLLNCCSHFNIFLSGFPFKIEFPRQPQYSRFSDLLIKSHDPISRLDRPPKLLA